MDLKERLPLDYGGIDAALFLSQVLAPPLSDSNYKNRSVVGQGAESG